MCRLFFFFQAEDGIRDDLVTGVQTCALPICQGRVWTGRQAKQLGLVDELGGLDRAVTIAKQKAKIAPDAEVELVIYPPKKSFYDLFKSPFGASDRAATLGSLLGFSNPRVLQTLAAPLQVFRRGEPLALMPNVFVR